MDRRTNGSIENYRYSTPFLHDICDPSCQVFPAFTLCALLVYRSTEACQ